MKVRQVELFDANDSSRMFCWLDDDPRVKVCTQRRGHREAHGEETEP